MGILIFRRELHNHGSTIQAWGFGLLLIGFRLGVYIKGSHVRNFFLVCCSLVKIEIDSAKRSYIGGSGKTCLAYDKTKGLLGRLP